MKRTVGPSVTPGGSDKTTGIRPRTGNGRHHCRAQHRHLRTDGAMSATVDIDASLGRINARSRSCAQSTVGTLEKRRDVKPTGLLHGRSLSLLQKWRDVEEPPGVILVQAEEMSAIRTPVAPEQVRTFAHQMEDPVLPARWAILDVHDGQVLGLLRGRGLETPQRPAKNPAPMLRANTTAPVFNDEEKPARATAQVHKVARVGYCSDVGGSAFSAGCDRATTLIAVARHVGIHRLPHGACQPSRKRFAPSLGRRGRMCGRSRVKRSLSSALGITDGPAGEGGINPWGVELSRTTRWLFTNFSIFAGFWPFQERFKGYGTWRGKGRSRQT